MIYIKIKNNLITENNLIELKNIYSKDLYTRIKARIRVLKNTLNTELKDYPNIDIYLWYKNTRSTIGRFSNKKRLHLKRQDNDYYIVLYPYTIDSEYCYHNVLGFKKVLLHEFIHYKNFLLNKSQKHGNNLPAYGELKNLYHDLNLYKKEVKLT